MPLDSKSNDRNKKITDYTTRKPVNENSASNSESLTQNPLKRTISPTQPSTSKKAKTMSFNKMDDETATTSPTPEVKGQSEKGEKLGDSDALQKALGPLLSEFKMLWESMKSNYADLKQTITNQKEELQQELVNKIDSNTKQLSLISQENKTLQKENDTLKTRLDKIKQDQLRNNVMVTGIQEGLYEQYSMTKLRIQEMIAVTLNLGNAASDLETAKSIEITNCK